MPSMLTDDTMIARASQQVSAELSGETVLLQLASGKYHALNSVGSFVWERLATPHRLADLRAAIVADYDVSAEQCDADLRTLVADLLAAGLVTANSAD